jgi:hypothetical protein
MLRSIMSEYLVDTNRQTQLPRNRGPHFCIQNKKKIILIYMQRSEKSRFNFFSDNKIFRFNLYGLLFYEIYMHYFIYMYIFIEIFNLKIN